MKKNIRNLLGPALGAIVALVFSSCAYDPYYSAPSTSVGGSYSSYSGGYGGGSTSLFISTGDPRWGYDPYSHAYYDYHRRSYYDPYLYSYYPSGYRPSPVYGVPHPRGYGRGYCPPPARVRDSKFAGYRDRESAYRNSNYGWANQVRGGGGQSQDRYRPTGRQRTSRGDLDIPQVPSSRGFERGDNSGRRTIRSSNQGLPSSYNNPVRIANSDSRQVRDFRQQREINQPREFRQSREARAGNQGRERSQQVERSVRSSVQKGKGKARNSDESDEKGRVRGYR